MLKIGLEIQHWNKVDFEAKREVKKNELEEYGLKKNIDTLETSAKTNINIDLAFKKILDKILANKSDREIIEQYGIGDQKELQLSKGKNAKNNKGKKDCC